jgi:hypothetical protein
LRLASVIRAVCVHIASGFKSVCVSQLPVSDLFVYYSLRLQACLCITASGLRSVCAQQLPVSSLFCALLPVSGLSTSCFNFVFAISSVCLSDRDFPHGLLASLPAKHQDIKAMLLMLQLIESTFEYMH